MQDKGIKMGRIQIFNNWSPYLVAEFPDKVWVGLEYFCSEYSSFYPMWAKVWAFFGMLKIGDYSKDTYTKRTNKTVSPFVELDPEILAKCMDLVLKYTRKVTNIAVLR